jgi:hypothetical protein
MSFGQLLAQFEDREELYVDLDQVADWIKALGVRHEIEFVGVDLETDVIRGFLYRYRYHKGGWTDPTYAAEIHYARNQEPEWINIVIAKELVHIMDGDVCSKKDEFDNLVRRLALPRELKIILEDPAYAILDRFGDAFAAALLLPMAARNLLMPAYAEGAVTAKDIAEMAVMPIKYVRMVMSPEWEGAYESMRKI